VLVSVAIDTLSITVSPGMTFLHSGDEESDASAKSDFAFIESVLINDL
jgi:hypothetical protein